METNKHEMDSRLINLGMIDWKYLIFLKTKKTTFTKEWVLNTLCLIFINVMFIDFEMFGFFLDGFSFYR